MAHYQFAEIQEVPEQQSFQKQDPPQPSHAVTAEELLETKNPPKETTNEDSDDSSISSEASDYSMLEEDMPCGNELKNTFDNEPVS